jgi:hypothetical protein
MFPNSSEIEPKVLKELITAGSFNGARVEPFEGALVVVVTVGMAERTLGVSRGGIRTFQSLDGAASVLQSYGIEKFSVSTRNWVPKTASRATKEPAARRKKIIADEKE